MSDFSRMIRLLREEKGISQKNAAMALGVKQAMMSHYENGTRECGLDFVVKAADYYGVSCDYLLGRSPDPTGARLSVENIPDGDTAEKGNLFKGSMYMLLSKKLTINSLCLIYDLLAKSKNEGFINNVCSYITLGLYRVFRLVFSANENNSDHMFKVPRNVSPAYTLVEMERVFADASSIAEGKPVSGLEKLEDVESLAISSERLSSEYPEYFSSITNLVAEAEEMLTYLSERGEK